MANVFSPLAKLVTLVSGAAGAWFLYSALGIDHEVATTSAVNAKREEFHGERSARLSYYVDDKVAGRPLVLIHSINAAASAYEMRPLFEHYRPSRPVYALDLPGFGFSERRDREYNIDLFVNAIVDLLQRIDAPADVVGLSLTCEFIARAAMREPSLFNTITLISPTGFTPERQKRVSQATKASDRSDSAYRVLANPLWSQPLYDLLVTKPGLRFFLGLNFKGDVDESLVEYAYQMSHQPGARHAPLHFLSGLLFSPDIFETVYKPLKTPALVLYDTDPNVTFDLLPELLTQNPAWRARRITGTRGLPHYERLPQVAAAMTEFWQDVTHA